MALSPPSGPGDLGPGPGDGPPAPDPVAVRLVHLMSQVALGRQDAFAELYDLTKFRIHGLVLRILRSPEHAAEVTQEIYLEVWQQAPRYAPERGSVAAWMTTMAHRRAVDRVRSASSETARDERYSSATQQRDIDEVWDSVEQQYDIRRVRAAMAQLTPIQREALQLAYFEGLTQSQIAQRLGLALGTVKTRVRDALKHLRTALGGELA